MAEAGPILEARGLRKTYRGNSMSVEALRGVDLAIDAGEMVAITGPSGCGKTTLLHCLSGLDDFDEGEVVVAGFSLRLMHDDQRTDFRARNTGFVFQAYNLLPILTARENVELPLLLLGMSGRQARTRALEALQQVGVLERAEHRPRELSGGQQQRVAIARALVNEPAIVWADEPTGNVDSDSTAELLALFGRLNRERGQTLVIVTHSATVAERAHRIVRMRDGEIVGEELSSERQSNLRRPASNGRPLSDASAPPIRLRP